MQKQEFLIALGSNLSSEAGGPKEALTFALQSLSEKGLQLKRVSRFFATPCFPAGTGPDYVNAAAVVHADMAPDELLTALHEIEAALDRRRENRWGARTLDLDLLAASDTVLPDPDTFAAWRDLPLADQQTRAPDTLILPHPRIQDRAFVLVPLCDVAPDWRHPVLDRTARQLCDALPSAQIAEVRPL